MRRTILCIGRSIGLSIPLALWGVVALVALRNPPSSLFVGLSGRYLPHTCISGPWVARGAIKDQSSV